MAGTFVAQTKIRPGAYIVFKGTKESNPALGRRGIVAIPMELSWGDTSKLIRVTAEDFMYDRTLKLIGLRSSDAAAQPLRELFKNASVALVGRLNTSKSTSAVATKTLTDGAVTFTAVCSGEFGNKLQVACVANTVLNTLELITVADGTEVDRQTVTDVASFVENGWITVSAAKQDIEFEAFAGEALTGGANGDAVTADDYTAFMTKASGEVWNVMAVTTTTLNVQASVKTYIENLRENVGKKVQAVVYNYSTANYEGIISIDQGYKLGDEVVPVSSAIAYIAGMTAGAEIYESNTYHVIEGATEIVSAKSDTEIDSGLLTGKMILAYRQDRAVVIEKDINTLYNLPEDRNIAFTKNRVIRCLDDIATQVGILFENSFLGKVTNDESGRTLFKGAVIGYMNRLQGLGAIQNFDSNTDIDVSAGNDIESVVVNLAIQPLDSMEKLYMTVQVS